ncbi:MAG: CRISPR-associated endonuclease Cas1 [Verrucomicrobiales bacterium]
MESSEEAEADPSHRVESPGRQGSAEISEGSEGSRRGARPPDPADAPDPPDDFADLVARTMAEVGEGDRTVFADPIPSRMLNEFVYCRRLFYYEFVEGVFRHNADTRRGKAAHSRVDRKKSGALPESRAKKRSKEKAAANGDEPDTDRDDELPETIHSRSVSLGSEGLGVTAKLDLVEVRRQEGELFSDLQVCPVEYKVGSPKEDEDGLPTLWDTDKMQLGLQILLLRENGYECDEGILFYRGTRQRVRLPMTADLERWIVETIGEARRCAASPSIPPPLDDSPKCVRCSLAPVCLPDETRMLIEGSDHEPEGRDAASLGTDAPRRLVAAGDEKRVVYLSTPGLHVGSRGDTLRVTKKSEHVEDIPIHDVLHLGLFGNVGVSTPVVRELCRREIPVSWFSTGGWYYGQTHGHGLKNVTTRIAQFAAASDETVCLRLARAFVRGKIRNQRTLLRRNHVEPDEAALKRLKRAADADTARAASLAELLGIEGAAAHVYFQRFSGMLKAGDDDSPAESDESGESGESEREEMENGEPIGSEKLDFQFDKRNRRPPLDPVNALLSFSYSLLTKDCAVAASAVGMDPYVGFYHQPRHGRPALALDVMEEFRPLVADSAVLSAINNRVVTAKDFVRAGSAVNLTPEGRKRFLQVWERRMRQTVTHPVFGYKVSYRRAIELQFRMLARVLTGEIEKYIPFLTR